MEILSCPNVIHGILLQLFSLFYTFIFIKISVDSAGKQQIVITRCFKKAELFDRPPPSPQFDDFWVTLLCHGGSLFDRLNVNVNAEGFPFVLYLGPCRWYPRCLFKTLLLVSTILFVQVFFSFFQKMFPTFFRTPGKQSVQKKWSGTSN